MHTITVTYTVLDVGAAQQVEVASVMHERAHSIAGQLSSDWDGNANLVGFSIVSGAPAVLGATRIADHVAAPA